MSGFLADIADEAPPVKIGVTACAAGGYAEDYPGFVCPIPTLPMPAADLPPPTPPWVAFPQYYVQDKKTGKAVPKPKDSYEWVWWVGLGIGALALAPALFSGRKR